MPSVNVEEYPAFREYAQKFGADEASWAKGGIEWNANKKWEAARAKLTHRDRARRGRFAELLAAEVAHACSSQLEWRKVVREHQRRLADFEAERALQRRVAATVRKPRPARTPTPPPAPTPLRRRTPAPVPAPQPSLPPAAVHPDLLEADRAEARGDHFVAARLRRGVSAADHAARRRRVEAQVARDEITFQRLRDRFGEAEAERAMQDPQ